MSSAKCPVSLYYLVKEAGIDVTNQHNVVIGVTTGYVARPNGTANSIGSIEVKMGNTRYWIEGMGVYIEGIGIKWTSYLDL